MERPCSPDASGPYVLLIEDAARHALIAETLLREAGFVIERLPAPGIAEQRASTLLRALRAGPAPGRSASLPPATLPGQPLAWNRRLVSLLLTNPLQLLRAEPAASHFRVYGGAQAIVALRASLRALPLPAAQLRLLECLLARLERVSVEHLLPELNISRRTYHRQLDLLVRIAECELNRGLVQAHAQPRPAAPLDGAGGPGR